MKLLGTGVVLLTLLTTMAAAAPVRPAVSDHREAAQVWHPPAPVDPTQLTPVAPSTTADEEGWSQVSFAHGKVSDQTFSVTSRRALRVSLTDTACRGEAFAISANQTVRAISPTVRPTKCPPDDPTQVDNPWVAFVDPTYSHTSFVLRPGTYTLSVTAVVTPYSYGAGAAWLHVDAPPRLPICSQNSYACDQTG